MVLKSLVLVLVSKSTLHHILPNILIYGSRLLSLLDLGQLDRAHGQRAPDVHTIRGPTVHGAYHYFLAFRPDDEYH